MRLFSSAACIDWSGAATAKQPGIAVAMTDGRDRIAMVQLGGEHGSGGYWTRTAVRDWLAGLADQGADVVIGLDLSPALPFIDCGGYFPEWDESPPDAKALWALVDRIARDDAHLSATSFVAHADARRHFRDTGWRGDMFSGSMGRLRVCEHGQARMGLRPASCFNLIGAAQVGKSSLTGMRVLHQLAGRIPVWPFDPVPERGPCIVEIYTSLAGRQVGVTGAKIKVLDRERLSGLIATLGYAAAIPAKLTDHASDALLTAAWLSRAARDPVHWTPAALTPAIAATEGWTFGVISSYGAAKERAIWR